MPVYEYECRDCDVHFERFQRFSDEPITTCSTCGGRVRRVIHPVGIVFKGSGWYITDSRKGEGTSTASDGAAAAAKDAKADSSTGAAKDAKADSSTGAADKTTEKVAAK